MPVRLYAVIAATDQDDVFWFVPLHHRDANGNERLLTRGWLRGTHREVDASRSTPWQPYHTHTRRESVPIGDVVEYAIEIRPVGIELVADLNSYACAAGVTMTRGTCIYAKARSTWMQAQSPRYIYGSMRNCVVV